MPRERFTELLSSKDKGIQSETNMHPAILLLLVVLVAAGTYLPNFYLANERGIHFTEPLAGNA
jgi:hypothetical protein